MDKSFDFAVYRHSPSRFRTVRTLVFEVQGFATDAAAAPARKHSGASQPWRREARRRD